MHAYLQVHVGIMGQTIGPKGKKLSGFASGTLWDGFKSKIYEVPPPLVGKKRNNFFIQKKKKKKKKKKSKKMSTDRDFQGNNTKKIFKNHTPLKLRSTSGKSWIKIQDWAFYFFFLLFFYLFLHFFLSSNAFIF